LPPGAHAPRSPALAPLFEGRAAIDGQPTLYICENFACQQPVVGREAILQAIRELGK
jgi:uncharacterized protein